MMMCSSLNRSLTTACRIRPSVCIMYVFLPIGMKSYIGLCLDNMLITKGDGVCHVYDLTEFRHNVCSFFAIFSPFQS